MSFRWVASEDERRRPADGPEVVLRFAVDQGPQPATLTIELEADAPVAAPPNLVARAAPGGGTIPIEFVGITERAGNEGALGAGLLTPPDSAPGATPRPPAVGPRAPEGSPPDSALGATPRPPAVGPRAPEGSPPDSALGAGLLTPPDGWTEGLPVPQSTAGEGLPALGAGLLTPPDGSTEGLPVPQPTPGEGLPALGAGLLTPPDGSTEGLLVPQSTAGEGRIRFILTYALKVPPAPDPARDDEVVIDVTGAGDPGQEVPPCRVVLRRNTCKIEKALLGPEPVSPEAAAALRWQGWGQYREVVGLKRFTTGRGGSDVLVVRPRLQAPAAGSPSLDSSGPPEVLADAWGSCLLIKTGQARDIRKEWDRFATFLASRLHPFLARCEAILPIRTRPELNQPAGPPGRITLISSFVGGDLVHPEPLEEVIRGASDLDRCNRLVNKVFAVLAPWQTPSATHYLKEWRRVYRLQGANRDDWRLFGKFDLTKKSAPEVPMGRNEFGAGLRWDTSFIAEEHLHHHLMGKNRDGLLYELREIQARFSLTHGDLNPRNILCEGEDIWLIDFEHTGVAPTLMDYARLEANLRLWCLPLRPAGENVEDAARAFEARLLDHFLGSEGGLEPTRELAASLGADPDDLHRIAHIIAHIRQLAAPHCLPVYADRRDYLAVLYLTVLSLLQYSGRRLAPPENDRALVSLAWLLEEVLDRILDREPHDRKRITLQPKHLLTAGWILPPGAPQRVVYFLNREDGRRALDLLAATRDVLQYPPHHLDVLDHILLVLANVEALIEDPLGGFLDPAALDLRVEEALKRQGIDTLPIPEPEATPAKLDTVDLTQFLAPIREALARTLADECSRLLLKWTALLHDVGKPGTRSVKTENLPYKVQFIGHEIYGLQLLEELLQHLFPDPVAAGPGLLERIRRFIQFHHLHHQIVQKYKEHPDSLRALVDGLKTREVSDAEYDFLAKFLELKLDEGRIAGDYQPDFPLLILFGFADRLACRGPDNVTSVSTTARIDLAVLTFWALFGEIKARRLKRKRKREQASRVFGRLSERLRRKNGIDPDTLDDALKKKMGKAIGQFKSWYNDQCKKRKARDQREPLLHELLAEGERLLRGHGII